MSMHVSVYVGPYLRVKGMKREDIEKYEHILTDGIGEAGTSGDSLYLIPNCDVPGITRQLSFSQHDYPSPIADFEQRDETDCFMAFALTNEFIAEATRSRAKIEVQWGIVCGVF